MNKVNVHNVLSIKFVVMAIAGVGATLSLSGQSLGYAEYASDFGAQLESGFYGEYNPAAGDVPDTAHGWSHLLTVRHQNASNNYQLQIAGSYAVNDRLFFRKIAASGTSNPSWNELATRGINVFEGDQVIDQGSLRVEGPFVPAYMQLALIAQGTDQRSGVSFWNDSSVRMGVLYFGNNELIASNDLGGPVRFFTGGYEWLHCRGDGNVGIGTTSPANKLEVNGTIRAKEVVVEAQPWPDYVFEDGYELPSLSEVEGHIAEHGHLPDVPPASAVEKSGLPLAGNQALMMRKIEELTLYLIEKDKQVTELREELRDLRSIVEEGSKL